MICLKYRKTPLSFPNYSYVAHEVNQTTEDEDIIASDNNIISIFPGPVNFTEMAIFPPNLSISIFWYLLLSFHIPYNYRQKFKYTQRKTHPKFQNSNAITQFWSVHHVICMKRLLKIAHL